MPKLPARFSEKMYKEQHNPRYLVIKGNRIVQDAHYTMPLMDQKIMASLIRTIKPGQKSLTVKFSTNQFVSMLGLSSSGTNFDNVMYALKRLADESFYILLQDNKYHLWRWLDGVIADPHAKGRGNFKVTFKPYLRKYLFNESLKYRTIYPFSDVMLMHSQYSPRIYELFRSNQSRQKVQKRGLNYSLNELKYSLDLMRRRNNNKIWRDRKGNIKFKYPRLADFKRRVIRPAIKEINMLTEYNIHLSQVKHGRKVVGFNVVMLRKNKKQQAKRDDIVYCITHHIPKSEWKTWREDKIRGKFYKVKRYQKRKAVAGSFSVVNHHKQKATKPNKIKVMLPNGQRIWINRNVINKSHASNSQDNSRAKPHNPNADKLLKKYAKQTDKFGYIQIYNPVVGDNVWTTKSSAVTIARQLNRKNNH